MINHEPLSEVLDNYDIKVISIKNENYKDKKGVWWVQTSNGYKILKKISNSEDTLKYILHATKHLSQNGIYIPSINQTKKGEDYVIIEGVCYVLSDAIEGRNPNFANKDELEKAVRGLAKFHKASEGFKLLEDMKPKIHLGKWIKDYTKEIEDIYTKSADYQDKTVIMNDLSYFYNLCKEVIQDLNGDEYLNWTQKVQTNGGLCHQDYAAGNLIIDDSGRLFVLDTDSITIDIPARDIRKFINKIIKKIGNWDIELIKKFFSYYQSANPLSPNEWKVVKLDLAFPHLFIGAVNKYYYRRDKEWTEEKYLKRIKEMSIVEKSKTEFLNNFDSIIPR